MPELLKGFGGEVLVADHQPDLLEGGGPVGFVVVFRFPDRATFDAFYQSPKYQVTLPARFAHSTGTRVPSPDHARRGPGPGSRQSLAPPG